MLKTGPFETQLKASEYVEYGTPVINVRNVGFGNLRADKLEYLPDHTVDRLRDHKIERGDIVFGRKGAVERHLFVRAEQEGWIQGSDCLRLRINSERVDPRFVSYCLLTSHHAQWIQAQASHGATMASLNQDILGRIAIPRIEYGHQRGIADILSAYDDLIENNTRRIAILEDMARRLFEEWFTNVPEAQTPDGWFIGTVSEVAAYINRGIAPKYDENGASLIINQKCVRSRRLSLAPARRQSKPVSADKVVRSGDVLINSTGVGTLGRVAQVFDVPPGTTVDSHVTIVRPKPDVNPVWFGLALLDKQSYFEDAGVGSTGQTELSRTRIADTELLIPAPEKAERFGAMIGPMRQETYALERANTNLRATRDLLLPKLISGEIEVCAAEEALETAAA
ncbi:restriction endonuclease subunit S [Sphingomonas sanguinis]|nr:restriction endonuclease subunit S [Sphingomonas sanguinis]